jgi:hypothetical protein
MPEIEELDVIEISDITPKEEEKKEEEEFKGLPPNSENGFTTDKYHWTQQHKEIVVYIPIEAHIKSKHINVKFTPDSLSIIVDNKLILKGDFVEKIKCEGSTWYLNNDGKKRELVVELEKLVFDHWWASVVKGEPKIDTSKVTPAQGSLDDLDQESKALAFKMMYEQQVKDKQKQELEKSKKK